MNNNHKFSILTLLVALLFSTVVEAQQIPINELRSPRQWSPQAKGAAIGTGVGAAAGAIINKRNRVVGGVVGGVAGGATGYAIGKHVDNKRKAAAALAARRAEEERIAAARRQDQLAYGEANRTMMSANKKAPSLPTAAVATGAVATGAAAAVGANAAASYVAARPGAQTGYVTDMGYLLNPTFGDQSSAYPDSEVRRKSW